MTELTDRHLLLRPFGGLLLMGRAFRRRRENPYYRMLLRMLWDRRPWLVLTLATLGCITLFAGSHVAIASQWRGDMDSVTSVRYLIFGFLLRAVYSLLSYSVILAFPLGLRFRAVLASPFYRQQLLMAPGSRRSIFEALGIQLIWLAPAAVVICVAFFCVTMYISGHSTGVGLHPWGFLSRSPVVYGLLIDHYLSLSVDLKLLLAYLAVIDLFKIIVRSLLVITLILMALLRVRRIASALLLATAATPLISIALALPRYLLYFAGIDPRSSLFFPGIRASELWLSALVTSVGLLLYLAALSLLWNYCFRWLDRRQLPLEREADD